MLFVSDFFTRHKEAVSNQLELLAKKKSGKIIAATRFMGQKALKQEDIRDGIYIVPALFYPLALALALLGSHDNVHIFEEESFWWKVWLLNLSRRPLYISLYRRPIDNHIKYIQQYKHLKKIFVELPAHKQFLVSQGFRENQITVTPTPAKLQRRRSHKKYNSQNVNIVFASWNTSERNALNDRGVIYLLDLLKLNPEYSLSIPLRDSNTAEFLELARQKGVNNRVNLLTISSPAELEALFDAADFVAFVAQERVVKDVPNSLIDGLAYGKPVIVSKVLDFYTIVAEEGIGIVVEQYAKPQRMEITHEEYDAMSKRAYRYSARHTLSRYQEAGTQYEVEAI